jgi:hypothetical protein
MIEEYKSIQPAESDATVAAQWVAYHNLPTHTVFSYAEARTVVGGACPDSAQSKERFICTRENACFRISVPLLLSA